MHSNGSSRGLAVAGNGTLDIIIEGIVSVDGPNIEVKSYSGVAEFVVMDPPVERGQKHTVNENIGDIVIRSNLWHRYVPGGGGFNTLRALRDIQEEGIQLAYLDVSNPTSSTMESLRKLQVYDSHHFWRREIPTNAILGYGGDRIVLRSPQMVIYSPREIDWKGAEHYIEDKDALLINSVKDPDYVELYIDIAREHGIPLFFSITTSLKWDFVRRRVLPFGTVLLNYDDLAKTHQLRSKIDEQIISRGLEYAAQIERSMKMDLALETLQGVRKLNPDKNAYATMGENGAYVSSKEGIAHVVLREDYAWAVRDAIRKYRETTNAAGDYFFAAVAYHEVFSGGMSALDIAIKASENAIRHIGYWGPLPREAFNVREPHLLLRAA